MDAKEKYMRDQGKTSVQLGLVAPPVTESSNKKKLSPVQNTYIAFNKKYTLEFNIVTLF